MSVSPAQDQFAYYQPLRAPCDFCHVTPRNGKLYVVRDGKATGKYCRVQHWRAAKRHMEAAQKEDNENTE